jgi:hypothetical protein
MDVSRSSHGHQGLPKSDITRPSRKAIQESLPPLPDPAAKAAEDAARGAREKKSPEEIREARQQHAAEQKVGLDKRRQAQRKKHTAMRHAHDATRTEKLAEKRARRAEQGNHAGAAAATGASTGPDRVQISATSRLARGEVERGEAEAKLDAERSARVAELREQLVQGRLNTPERISRAAARMLGEAQ